MWGILQASFRNARIILLSIVLPVDKVLSSGAISLLGSDEVNFKLFRRIILCPGLLLPLGGDTLPGRSLERVEISGRLQGLSSDMLKTGWKLAI